MGKTCTYCKYKRKGERLKYEKAHDGEDVCMTCSRYYSDHYEMDPFFKDEGKTEVED